MNIRLFGHLRAGFGLAGGAKATIRALEAAGCRVFPVDLALATHAAVDQGISTLSTALPKHNELVHVDLVHTNPNVLASSPELLDPDQFTAPIRIGYWAWELEQFPRGWERFFADYQEIWCPSCFTAQALVQRSPVPVVTLPHLPDWPRLERLALARQERFSKAAFDHPFTFLCLFDFWSTPERKNPQGAIEAFQRAFPLQASQQADVRLVIKTSSSDQFPDKAEVLRALTASDRRIQWVDALLSQDDLEALYLQADALVSLHRAEGFGLTLADAMGMGLPVIATGYSGNTDFMPAGSACLIPWSLQRIPQTRGDYVAGSFWAEPCCNAAAEAMRSLASDHQGSRRLGLRGREIVRERLAAERVAAVVRQRLGCLLLPEQDEVST
ncbi:MAG: glycosyltransferase family 4 protein [Prochlorococcus sp.]